MTLRGKLISIGILILPLLFGLSYYVGAISSDLHALTSSTNGQIVVNSPSVYTRQRLVNDRFAQSAWLKEQLKVTSPNPAKEREFYAIDEVLIGGSLATTRANAAAAVIQKIRLMALILRRMGKQIRRRFRVRAQKPKLPERTRRPQHRKTPIL
jgi:hypothetical protein